jgi:hypothetical protein
MEHSFPPYKWILRTHIAKETEPCEVSGRLLLGKEPLMTSDVLLSYIIAARLGFKSYTLAAASCAR